MSATTKQVAGELITEQRMQLPAQAQAEVVTPMALIEKALERDIDPEKLEKLMDLQDRWQNREAEKEFNQAMNRCQSELGRIAANKTNSQTRSQYADYAALDRVVRPVYSRHDLALSFDTKETGASEVLVVCYVSHSAGHTRTYRVLMPADGKGAKGGDVMTKTHAAGSGISYGMRYLLKMIFNLAIGQDDDGNAASVPPVTFQQAAQLRDELAAVDGDEAAFCRYLKVSSLEDLPSTAFDTARALINKKRSAK